MAKKRAAGHGRRAAPPETRRDPRAWIVTAILAAVLVGTGLAVDTGAAAAFDAPKRLIALLGTAMAAAVAFAWRSPGFGPARAWRGAAPARRVTLALASAALAGTFVAALASARREVSLDAMRTIALLALLLPLGASRFVARGRAWLAAAFLASCAVNSLVSILQATGRFHPFSLETAGARQDTGAYAGNVGYLAIALALESILALGILVSTQRPAIRAAAALALALSGAALVVNQNLTALSALAVGAGILLIVRFRRGAALPLGLALAAAVLAVAAYAPLRTRAVTSMRAARAGNWDALLSFRGGPWGAAAEMARERPLTGFGPGAFGAEYVSHRLAAEIRARRRLVSPLRTSSYAEAHNDYLQAASDAGIPVALLVIGAAASLLGSAARAAWSSRDLETGTLVALLAAGACAALTWFPLQRPVTAVPLLLAAGRAWRVTGPADPAGAP